MLTSLTTRHGAMRLMGGRVRAIGRRFLPMALKPRAEALVLPALKGKPTPVDYAQLLLTPPCLLPADPVFALEYAAGAVALDGATVHRRAGSIFAALPPTAGWHQALHGFTWLTHLRAAGTEAARDDALALTAEWFLVPHPTIAWQADVASRRLLQWLSHADWLLPAAPASLVIHLTDAVSETVARIARGWRYLPPDATRLAPLIALTVAYLALPDTDEALDGVEVVLVSELAAHVSPDGMPGARNPSAIVPLLQDMIALKQSYAARGRRIPVALQALLTALPTALQHMRMGDGLVARFNGTGGSDPATLAGLLAQCGHRMHLPALQLEAPNSSMIGGYARLAHGPFIVLLDAASAPQPGPQSYAGCLSLAVTYGADLVFSNQGADRGGSAEQDAARSSASHSMLVLNHSSAATLNGPNGADRRSFVRMARVRNLRQQTLGHDLTGQGRAPPAEHLAFEHDGYVARHGLAVERRIWLAADGRGLSGIDSVREVMTARRRHRDGGGAVPSALHFHLGPRVGVERLGPREIRLVLPSGPRLMFKVVEGQIELEASLFRATARGNLQTRRLVVRGHLAHGDQIHWDLAVV